ncbi:MAG: AAA family ATPase [Pseudomonadota bacterium]
MWIERPEKKRKFIQDLLNLDKQVLILRGARQVGKTSFILNVLNDLKEYPQLKLNLLYPTSFSHSSQNYLGRDFFGSKPNGEEFLKNISIELGNINNLSKPAIIFLDEVDRHPLVLEAVQSLAEFSANLKFIFTGSNLENILVENAATGRKKYFDLYPITYQEFLLASGQTKLINELNSFSLTNSAFSDYLHDQLLKNVEIYVRIGGMPRVISTYLDSSAQAIPEIIKDLVISIEENVKIVLGDKSKLYEYEDILRKIAWLSLNTLKYTNLQVQHAGRKEAKKLVFKTVGARVAHKIRLLNTDSDLSKYILFDCGITNYLLSGADLLRSVINERAWAVLWETFVGIELVSTLFDRADLFYWKSGNKAELEYLLRSPKLAGIDVKTSKGDNKSLASFAVFEPQANCLVKICQDKPNLNYNYQAKLPTLDKQRNIPLLTLPHYLTSRLPELLDEI